MKTCSYCGSKNHDSASVCSACAKPFVSAGGDLKDVTLDPVIVGTFENTEHAGVLKAELDAAGIEAWIPEDCSIEFPPQSVTVQVAAKDAAAAREITAEFRRASSLESAVPNAVTSETAEATGSEESVSTSVPNRRACVSCGAAIPYEAVLCPKCGWTQPQMS